MKTPGQKQMILAVCLTLAAMTLALYCPVLSHGFLNYDDDAYITDNPHVTAGLTWAGIVWAFKSGYAANWHPLTWISHMLDCQLFGLNPAGHHLVNVLFHTANTLLLFLLLLQWTGALWRSAFVSALFAWHPLHVESVAWAAERKDVLSAFFWLLTLFAYTQYARVKVPGPRRALCYLLALFLFACGLMSKPMVVTLPFVLLLLDFWPLGRLRGWTEDAKSGIKNPVTAADTGGFKGHPIADAAASPLWLLFEKIPFFALSLAASIVTYLVQKRSDAVVDKSLSIRILNALWAYERYIAKTFWPANLSIVYPFREHGLVPVAVESAALLVVCSLAFITLARRWPYLFVGWFWFLGVLVPVIGIVSVGSSSMADRYAYLPSIGLFLLVTWGLADLFQSSRVGRSLLAAGALAALGACAVLASVQIRYWRNSITLFHHALAVTTNNYVAAACLGQALDAVGNDKDALVYCHEAVRLNPDYPAAQFFLGQVLWHQGETAKAIDHLDAAARVAPHSAVFQYSLGKFFAEHSMPAKAAACFSTALDDEPDFAEAHNALGKTLLQQGKLPHAADELAKAAELEPGNAQFHYDLGTVLLSGSKFGPAIDQFQKAIQLKPDFAMAHENLAVALANEGKLDQAIPEFSTAAKLDPHNASICFSLGLALLNNHQPAEAAEQFRRELLLSPQDVNAHYRLAQALRDQNQWTEAAAQYRRTLQLAPNFPEAEKELDEILAAHPEPDSAKQ